MASSKTEDVFRLVKSMNKAEKRAFKLFARRTQSGTDMLYLKLFDLFDKLDTPDDALVKKKLGFKSNTPYTNVKRHLYIQVLNRLRLLEKEKRANMKIRELIDFCYVLYGKGLYQQALKMLASAKQIAYKNNADFSTLTIVEIEKMIHSRHITRSKSKPIDDMIAEASNAADTISNRINLSNLRLKMHKIYVEKGHVKNEAERQAIEHIFKKELLPEINLDKLGLIEKVYYYQSHVWYYYILNDFEKCYQYSLKWIEVFKAFPNLRNRDIHLYLRGYHYLITSCFNLKRKDAHQAYLMELETFRKKNYSKFEKNTKIISFLYTHSGRMNNHFLNKTFEAGVAGIPRTLKRLKRYEMNLDPHKVMVIYYKIAWMYLGANRPKDALNYLLYITQMSKSSLREDIQSYTRLMHLMAVYDLDNVNMLLKLIRSYDKFFAAAKEKNLFQVEVLAAFRKVANAPVLEVKGIWQTTYEKLRELESNPYEQRAFLYLDVLYWVRGKM